VDPAFTRRRGRRGGEEHETVRGGHALTSVLDVRSDCPGRQMFGVAVRVWALV
jgi:hypothetical protein